MQERLCRAGSCVTNPATTCCSRNAVVAYPRGHARSRRARLSRVRAAEQGWHAHAGDQVHDQAEPKLEPSRTVPLSGDAVWFMDYLQDKWYDVLGPSFVIRRAESEAPAGSKQRKPVDLAKQAKEAGLVRQALRHYQGTILQLEGGVVDVAPPDIDVDDQDLFGYADIVPNTTCTGIVPVEVPDLVPDVVEEGSNVYWTSSSSPRRTKMVGFTCKLCGARNYNQVNPRSFNEGTLVAQCGGCEKWHKLTDHLGLFHSMAGPLFRTPVVLDDAEIPESLRMPDGGLGDWLPDLQ